VGKHGIAAQKRENVLNKGSAALKSERMRSIKVVQRSKVEEYAQ